MAYKTFEEYKAQALKNPKIKKEYDLLQDEYNLVDKMLTERENCNLTQEQLSSLTGIPQADISRIESGKGNPTLKTLRKIAQAFGKRLEVSFV